MELGSILTYISIIIAIYAFSPEYLKIKWKLANMILKLFFLVSIVLLFILSFPSIQKSEFFMLYKNFIEDAISVDIHYDIYFLILWIVQLISLLIIINSKTLRRSNIQNFCELLNNLLIQRKWDILFLLLEKNMETIFYLENKNNRAKKMYDKYHKESFLIVVN